MRVKIKELGKIITGNTPSKKNLEFWDSKDICFIKPDIIADEGITAIDKSNEYISEVARSKARVVGKDTIFVTCIGSIGKIGIAEEGEYAFNQQINAVVLNSIINVRYLAYAILYSKPQLIAIANSAVVPIINKSQFGDFEINIVEDIKQQEEIVNILDRTKGIVESYQQELLKLDELIKARFAELFGNLELNDKTWKEVPLGEACSIVKRYPTFCNMEYIENGVRVIRIGNILADGHMDINDENYVFVYASANEDFPDTVIEENDVVMAVRGDGSTATRIGIVTEKKLFGANISPNLIRMKADNTQLLPIVFYYYLISEVGQQRLDAYVNKTAKKNIAAKDIVKVLTPIPSMDCQRQFADFVKQVDKSKIVVQEALNKAQLLFDSLMQEYFGQ